MALEPTMSKDSGMIGLIKTQYRAPRIRIASSPKVVIAIARMSEDLVLHTL